MITTTLREIFERELNKLTEEIKSYPNEESIWTVREGIKNSGGNLCLHICGNLQHFIGNDMGNISYVRNRDKEFSDKNIPVADLLKEIETTKKAVIKTLEAIPDSDLDKECVAFPAHLLGKEHITKFYFLAHLLSHLDYHIGQINYHRRLT